MKTRMLKISMAVLLVVFAHSTMSGQKNFSSDYVCSKKAVMNLISGIKSNNDGLKKSCIYFAGKYHISETVQVLITELLNSNDVKMICLIARSLYEIGDPEGIAAVKELTRRSAEPKVKNFGHFIITAYEKDPA